MQTLIVKTNAKELFMKRQTLVVILNLALTFSLFGSVSIAHAQTTCTDATGATSPCPPSGGDSGSNEEDDNGSNQPGGGNPNPPTDITATPSPTPSPEPTSTPLPLQAQPTLDPTKNAPVFEVTPTPTAEPVITSSGNDGATEGENDWEDVCTFDLCLGLTAACYWDGGTPEIVEDGSGNTGVHCTIPDDDDGAAAPFPWGPVGIVGIVVLLMVMLLPAVQKFKNKPDTPQGRSWDTFGDIKGDNVAPTSTPQTREHILLAKQQDGNTSGASKPKPKPKPAPQPTPPPAQPKPPSSGTPGDFNSDGTVDGNDFIP